MKNFRDIEQLSAYLDGQLSPSDSARLESRISSDPELASALSDLRTTRGILRKLPARKAPRNFTLTRNMVGLKPPLPRAFSFFRLSTAFATFLLMLTFAANVVIPRISLGAAAPAAQEAYGLGGGSGGGCNEPCSPPSLVAPQAAAATQAPVATQAPFTSMAIAPTETPAPSEDAFRVGGTPAAKGNAPASQNQPEVKNEALIPASWQIALLIVVLLSALTMFAVRQSAIRKWK